MTTTFDGRVSIGSNREIPMSQEIALPQPESDLPLPELLLISSFPPRVCGIASFTEDLASALQKQFSGSFTIRICPVETDSELHSYPAGTRYSLNVDHPESFSTLAVAINANPELGLVVIQHEFGLYEHGEYAFYDFLDMLRKPILISFHTVLPNPTEQMRKNVQRMARDSVMVTVMTKSSKSILITEYGLSPDSIRIIPHGTHLVKYPNRDILKEKYQLSGKKVVSTFGLMSAGKNIETTLAALPAVVKEHDNLLFLIIGKTHPGVLKRDGEKYREFLHDRVRNLGLENHVRFINKYLPLPELLEYLQLTDIYLFTSNNPYQAVSGTFAYAMSCGCPVISTPIPHAQEVLQNGGCIIFNFEDAKELGTAISDLLRDDQRRGKISAHAKHQMAASAWENTAITNAYLYQKASNREITIHYNLPDINLDHIQRMTTDFGMIQFSIINQADLESGYTLDDNARALIALCDHYTLYKQAADLKYIEIYFRFIEYCLQPENNFLNYVNEMQEFTMQNTETNLEDANGRAIWALGYMVSLGDQLPETLYVEAGATLRKALVHASRPHSSRAMAFIIKGLYYQNKQVNSIRGLSLIRQLANRLVQMYRHESEKGWQWFESYLTYANSLLPEALLCAWEATRVVEYREIARSAFDFLLSRTFKAGYLQVIANKVWYTKSNDENIPQEPVPKGGEQPIDVAYTVMALKRFNDIFQDDAYSEKMRTAFNWFLGDNHLGQIVYNPSTGGCYDGLEEHSVNLNQGAESTISYLMARLTVERSIAAEKMTPSINRVV